MRGSGRGGGGFGVTVEAQFTAGEYEVVILSAKEAHGLEGWLEANRYQIPAGASAALAPYVREGMKFFVAKVNIEKVIRDERGAVVLSPLRFDYEAPTLRLPVRLGLLNAKGKQDLVVYVLHPSSRFEAANYKNIFIPSNLEVENEVRDRFGAFYAALFDATLAGAKGPAVVTEYAWQTTSCDPCPRAPLTPKDLAALGGDLLNPGLARSRARLTQLSVKDDQAAKVVKRVLRSRTNQISNCHERSVRAQQNRKNAVSIEFVIGPDGRVAKSTEMGKNGGQLIDCIEKRVMRWRFPSPAKGEPVTVKADWAFTRSGGRALRANFSTWVLTRLHTRYDAKTLHEDLVFVEASPVTGGRGFMGKSQEGPGSVEPAQNNNFQGRYIIRHYWEGEAACESPAWGRWGARPGSKPGQFIGSGRSQKDKATAAKRRVERSAEPVPLAPFVRSSLPQLGLRGKGRPARKTKTP